MLLVAGLNGGYGRVRTAEGLQIGQGLTAPDLMRLKKELIAAARGWEAQVWVAAGGFRRKGSTVACGRGYSRRTARGAGAGGQSL